MIFGNLSGRLTADPTSRQGQNGNFTTFSVAVNHGKKDNVDQVTYVDCTANGKTGELVVEHFKKGNVFSGPAEFRMREYTGNDGQKKQQLSATVSMIDWQSSQTTPKDQATPAPAPQQGYSQQPPAGYTQGCGQAPAPQPYPGQPPQFGGPQAPPPAPAPQPAQYTTDSAGNQYQLINGQWVMIRPANAAPAPQGLQAPGQQQYPGGVPF